MKTFIIIRKGNQKEFKEAVEKILNDENFEVLDTQYQLEIDPHYNEAVQEYAFHSITRFTAFITTKQVKEKKNEI